MAISELHLHEYDKLQKEIGESLAQFTMIENFSILNSGAIFAWTLSTSLSQPVKYAFFLPFICTSLFAILAYGLFKRIKLMGEYIKTRYEPYLSHQMDDKLVWGWENYLETKGNSFLANGRLWLWILHLSLNLGIAFYLFNTIKPC